MPIGFRSITGLTFQQGFDGKAVQAIPGDGGMGPSSFIIIATSGGWTPGTGSIQLFPGGRTSTGADSNGNLSVTTTYVNNGDDKSYAMTWNGNTNLGSVGFWNGNVRVVINDATKKIDISIQFGSLDPNADFGTPPPLVDVPQNTNSSDQTEDSVNINWDYTNTPSAENPIAFVVTRDGTTIGSIPWISGTTHYSYNDMLTPKPTGSKVYVVKAYKYGTPNLISAASSSVTVNFSGVQPDVNVTGSGGINFGGTASFFLMVDPSGIYTLIPGKLHDTLYERSGSIVQQDVKIPDPFIRTGFLDGGS